MHVGYKMLVNKQKNCELLYGGVYIASAPDPHTLLREKCEMIVDGSVRYPEMLKIYIWDGREWLFDEVITTKKRASVFLHEGFPYY